MSPELPVAAGSWASTLVALFLIAGLLGVLFLNQRSRRRFHERQARERSGEPPL